MAAQDQRSRDSTSTVGGSLLSALETNLRLDGVLERQANEAPAAWLKRLLSTKSAISTSSSFAERQQAAVGFRAPFREIGTGSIGKVFEQAGTPWAFKALLIDRSSKLWNNYVMHMRIQRSFDQLAAVLTTVEIPRVAWFANPSSDFWPPNLELFPDLPTFPRKPRDIMCMDRIYPLPAPIRELLIDLFCPSERSQMAKADPANKDCLIRVLLGRRRYGASRPGGGMFFSLRNYKLHVDQVESLNLDAEEYAIGMADAMATLHWHTKIDGMDIEFVLGSTPLDRNAVRRVLPLQNIENLPAGTSTFETITTTTPNFKRRIVSLWMLDFDACNKISMDKSGVQQAITAFLDTEPCCPRPNANDRFSAHLWTVFSNRYLEIAKKITAGTDYQTLPQQFIDGVQEALRRRSSASQSDTTSTSSLQQPQQQTHNPLRAPPRTLFGDRSHGHDARGRGRGQATSGSDETRARGWQGGRGRGRTPLRSPRGHRQSPSR